MNLKDQLSVQQARYYPLSKRASAYLVIYLKCKCCDLFYTLEKPNSDESIIFCVNMTTEHDVESHKTENIRIMAQKRIDVAKEIILRHGFRTWHI